MDRVHIYGVMVIDILEIGKIIKEKEMVSFGGKMENFIMDNGNMIKEMD